LVHVETNNIGCCDRAVVVQQKLQGPSTLDDAHKVRPHRFRAVLRMPGNADRIRAEAFDVIVAALGLYIDK
jgi:hypothetical protein